MKCTCGREIKDHPAEPCLDELFAEKVIEWKRCLCSVHDWEWVDSNGDKKYSFSDFEPSLNIGQAMEGVEKADRPFRLVRDNDHLWTATICEEWKKKYSNHAERPALATTRAFILWAHEKGERDD